jgi:hypothetical protein
MKNPRKTLFYLFLAYNAILFIGSMYVDSKQNDLGFLLNFKSYIPWMKYITFTGLVLFLVSYVIVNRDIRLIGSEVKKSKEEHTTLKAKLFDLQEASKSSAEVLPVKEIPAEENTAGETNEDDSNTP